MLTKKIYTMFKVMLLIVLMEFSQCSTLWKVLTVLNKRTQHKSKCNVTNYTIEIVKTNLHFRSQGE